MLKKTRLELHDLIRSLTQSKKLGNSILNQNVLTLAAITSVAIVLFFNHNNTVYD